MYKRRVNLRKAYNKRVLNEPSKALPKQEEITKEIVKFIKEKDTNDAAGYGLHNHICTFEIMSNDRPWQKAQCKKWIKNHPVECDEYGPDCDFCEMFNYIALDDEGRLMYATRNFPEELQNYIRSINNENNNS